MFMWKAEEDHRKENPPVSLGDLHPTLRIEASQFVDFMAKIPRKPISQGIEIRTIADYSTGLLFGMELQEGKAASRLRPNIYMTNGKAGGSAGTAR